MPFEPLMNRLLTRRALAGAALGAASLLGVQSAAATAQVSLLCPRSPNPTPPGYGGYGQSEIKDWQDKNDAYVNVEAVSWEQIHDKISAGFDGRAAMHDVNYTAGWIPEFSQELLPLNGVLPARLTADMPFSSAQAVSWNGSRLGVPMTLSLLTLYTNTAHLKAAGIDKPPSTWAELMAAAKELTTAERAGWVINYGAPGGIGGAASYWMAFLQQAGGTMYGEDGKAAFNTNEGVEALQFMIDLMPFTHKSALTSTGITNATATFMTGGASMMMNWPFMWAVLNDRGSSPVSGLVQTSLLPAGPAGTASIDGADAWAISAKSKQQEMSARLIAFFLSDDIQTQQAVSTGWLPIRRSALVDRRVIEACPYAVVALQQASHPYSSFLTPDYASITNAVGTEIIKALSGKESPKLALAAAARSVNAIVKARK